MEETNDKYDKEKNYFAKKSKKTLIIASLLTFLIFLVIAEFSARFFMGLGNPILFDSNPFYGYRPLPNQEVSRFSHKIKINNIGLRADDDWDTRIDNKILFLGDSVTFGGRYVDNKKLFSHLSLKDIDGFKSGNAGVDGWGIENVYGLIVESQFLPSKFYIFTVIEDDFYRPVSIPQLSFIWLRKPKCALEEALHVFFYMQNNKRYISWRSFASNELTEKVVERAVMRLKKMDQFLKSREFFSLIYILPTKSEVLRFSEKDKVVLRHLKKHDLKVTYLIDQIELLNLDNKKSLFYDETHLEEEGHAVYAQIINNDLKNLLKK